MRLFAVKIASSGCRGLPTLFDRLGDLTRLDGTVIRWWGSGSPFEIGRVKFVIDGGLLRRSETVAIIIRLR